MRDEIQFRTEAGFSLSANYKIEDRDTTFRVMLAVFGCCFATGVVLGLQIAGLI
ncbi:MULTISPECIES: hypothetical protein [Brucella/Ochrobactrum group]|uniref:hypothetical protein n=1 Tax=Brucella/Ochrobactrum group TaxID=2826938 RepID=UPI00178C34D6|nr:MULTISPECIES: hypothetical protein [Brucella/Ochrobactrum group]MCQ9143310.1 hypothetical protein [Ochrobactrum sp. BTU2]UGQ23848.1 hypothetical protein LRL11_16440 [Brucella anthropi]